MDSLGIKIEDFTGWASAAYEHYINNRHPDSLTNIRKCGEAACKLIIFTKYSESAADKKIAQKSYKELIELIISENLAPRKAINQLESFQIYGNIATHDKRIVAAEVQYAISALQLFIEWLFTEHLRILVPAKLKKYNIAYSGPQHFQQQNELLQKELNQHKKETELLKRELELYKEKLQHKESEAETHRQQLQGLTGEITQFKTQVKQLLNEAEKREKAPKPDIKPIIKDVPKTAPHISKKTVYISAAAVFLGVIAVFASYRFFYSNPDLPEKESSAENDSAFTVLILPFSVMQDNPAINIRLEEMIMRNVKEKSQAKQLPVRVLYNDKVQPAQTQEQALSAGRKEKASLVIYGDLYEQKDSIQTIVKYVFLNPEDTTMINGSGEASNCSFTRLTDSEVLKLQDQVKCLVDMAFAYSIYYKQQYSKALLLANEISPTDVEMKKSLWSLKAVSYLSLGQYDNAFQEADSLLTLDSSGYSHSLKAKVFKETAQYDSADYYYKKSIALDSTKNNDYILAYADLLCMEYFKRYKEAKEYIYVVLERDSSKALHWFYLAEIEKYLKEFKAAKEHYERTLSLNPAFLNAKIQLGNILAFDLKEPTAALPYLLSAVQQDSTAYYAHHLLGQLYADPELQDFSLSQYHFEKSKQYMAKEDAGTYLGMCITAQEKKDIVNAKKYALKAYSLDSNRVKCASFLGAVYFVLMQFDSAHYLLQKAFSLDSLDETANYHLGLLYFSDPKYYDLKKSQYHFEKKLQIEPGNTTALYNLGMIAYKGVEYEKAKKYFLRCVQLVPNDFNAYKMLGSIYQFQQNFSQAKQYFNKALSINPNDEQLHRLMHYMLIMLKELQPALMHAKRAVEINGNGENYFDLAKLQFTMGDKYNARKNYLLAIELQPSYKNDTLEKILELQ